jgi:glycosyltransferase involved in cell wall biosynthesis
MNKGYYDYLKLENNNIIGRNEVNNIYEVLIDLDNINLNYLEKGISLIIRAKNEELNIKNCIESVVDLVDEIIFVDNNSTDNTYLLVKEYSKKYKNIKLYKYNINVSKVGVEHKKALNENNKNTLGTFYNWCLSKATKYNVVKWDADFICIRNNFKQLVDLYNLRTRDDMFALWFTGKTLFEDNNNYYINYESFYNEYRIFSYKNGFKWYDGNTCEYTDPFINKCLENKKFKYDYPLFYEVKRTSINEFEERSSLIDQRDINDYNILNNLKNKDTINLIKINQTFIYNNNKIIFCTPSLNWGGGNQFIINIYTILKTLGFQIFIFPLNNDNYDNNDKFNNIIKNDIYHLNELNISFIKKHEPKFIFFNSILPFNKNDINIINNYSKIIFVTHSDVAYSNLFIKNFHDYFYKIICVNQYTIDKLTRLLKINNNKFYKIINYSNIDNINDNNLNKKYKFGVLSRFSEDKNIPMFIFSLINVFKKYPNYTCYLVGSNNELYDNYLKNLIKINNLETFIKFVGYQNNTSIYYKKFDFIVLPSVSEGCSYNILEAMSYGLPVITSNVGGNHELINEDRGLLYNYSGIRNFESDTIYIENYNEQLSLIGYVEKKNLNNNINYKFINNYNEELIIPLYLSCKIHINNENDCSNCMYIKNKTDLFNQNKESIEKSIINMIEQNNYTNIKKNNIEFIKNNFNKNIYLNQIFSIFL